MTIQHLHDQTEALRVQVLDGCWGHPDGCHCNECQAQQALSDAAMHLRVASGDGCRWLVRYQKWLHGEWVGCEERYYQKDYAVRRFEEVNFGVSYEGCELMEVRSDDVRTVQRGRLDLVSAGAAPAAVPAVLRDGAGAVRLPAGA